MSEYPEHDKLHAVRDDSQRQGELLEWLASQGVHLMVWREWTEPENELGCARCEPHIDDAARGRCERDERCLRCEGRHDKREKHEGWLPWGRGIQETLAAFHNIDLSKIEEEKRAMLAKQRELNEEAR